MATTWDDEKDVEFTKLRLARTPVAEMAKRFGTTVGAVYAHARVLKAFVMDRKAWSDGEASDLLRMDDERVSIREIARRMRRTEQSVSWKLGDLGREANRMRYWKDDDARLVAMTRDKATPEDVAAALNRSVETVRDRLCFLGLGEARNRWDEDEESRLRTLVSSRAGADRVALALGRDVGSVRAKAYSMGLRFTDADRDLTPEEVEGLRGALKERGGLAAFAAEMGVSARWLRVKGRRAGLAIQTRRRRALDEAEVESIASAARDNMPLSEAIGTFGRDSRTLKEVAARSGTSFPKRVNAAPKPRMFKVRTSNAMVPESARPRPVPKAAVAKAPRPAVAPSAKEAATRDVERAVVAPRAAKARTVVPARRGQAARPPMDRAAMDSAVARFLASRAVTRESLDPVEETVRAIRRKGYAVVREADSFVVDGRTRLGDAGELVSFALARSIDVPVALTAA